MTPDRDTHTCSICKRLGSGIRLSRIFTCDDCSGKMLPETITEINEVWE